MRKLILTAVVCVVLGIAIGWLLFRSAPPKIGESQRRVLYYRDPMNPQAISPTPKKSADGMDYVPIYADATEGGQRKIAYYQDPMHPWYTSDKPGKAPDCGMDLVPVYEGEGETEGIKIDPVVVQNIGVKTETVTRHNLSKIIRAVGKVTFDETRVFLVNTKNMGWVEKLYVDYTGKLVHKGQPLLQLYSPELVTTQEEYLQALRYQEQLPANSSAAARSGAEQLVQSARQRLLYWDISASEIKNLEERGTTKKTIPILSPADGFVMEKMVLPGQNIMPGMELYKIADLRTIWVLAEIYPYEMEWIKLGQKAEIELSYLPGKSVTGTIAYIYPDVNMETRTVKVRIVLQNTAQFDFKPEMFATVKMESPMMANVMAAPEQAIIYSGERSIAIIAKGGGYFEPREISLGATANGYVQILAGIKEGEKIVTSSQFLIDSESNLKAAISQMQRAAGTAPGKSAPDSARETTMPMPARSPLQPAGLKESPGEKSAPATELMAMPSSQKQIYTCEMHPEVRSDKPGNCPICGMKLVLVKSPVNQPEPRH